MYLLYKAAWRTNHLLLSYFVKFYIIILRSCRVEQSTLNSSVKSLRNHFLETVRVQAFFFSPTEVESCYAFQISRDLRDYVI